MNEQTDSQFQIDFRTGSPTLVFGGIVSDGERKACAILNRQRASAIKAIAGQDAPRESLSIDVWTAALARTATAFEVPLISLTNLGFEEDDLESMHSRYLGCLGLGREASAWADRDSNCVYKLFDLRENGTLGFKLRLQVEPPYDVRITQCQASINDILDKLCALHEAGACPTEIVGLSDNGEYLIAKQPRCKNWVEFEADKMAAIQAMNAVSSGGSFGMEIRVFWADGKPWCIGDLHEGNIRRLEGGQPTVIDALVCEIPAAALKVSAQLHRASEAARLLATGGVPLSDDPFHGVSNDDL